MLRSSHLHYPQARRQRYSHCFRLLSQSIEEAARPWRSVLGISTRNMFDSEISGVSRILLRWYG